MTGRPRQAIPRSERGAALLAALCLAMVFIISLGSYLTLCNTSLNVSTRSLMFNHGTELAEAGVEQALYALNNNDWSSNLWTTGGSIATSVKLTMTSAGLVATSSSPTPLNYGNGMNGTVTVIVSNVPSFSAVVTGTTAPQITATSTMTMPGYAGSSSQPTVTQTVTYGASTGTLSGGAPIFVNAVATITGKLKFQSAGTVDSYDSVLPATSLWVGANATILTSGTTNWTSAGASSNAVGTVFTATAVPTGTGTAYVAYFKPASPTLPGNAGYSAVVLSQDTTAMNTTINLKNATVNGYAVGYDSSNPGSTDWLSYGSSGELVGPNTGSTTFIDSTRILPVNSPYQPVVLESSTLGYPYSSASSTLPAAVSTSGYPYFNTYLNQGGASIDSVSLGNTGATVPVIYQAGSGINLTGSIVTIHGPVIIISYGNINISGSGGFVLDKPQSSLQIFQEYGSVNITGSVGISWSAAYVAANPGQILPKKVAIMGTNDNWSSVTLGQTVPFYGVVYFPYESISVSTNGAGAPIYGSIVGDSVTFSASPVIHYDLALRSPTTTYSSALPLQSGPAFIYMNAPLTVGSLTASAQ